MFDLVRRVMRRAFAARRLRREMRAVPHVALPDLVEDTVVRVTGQARPGGPVLEAALTKRVCVYYSVTVLEWRRDGSVRQVASEHEGIEFALEHGAYRITIDTREATVSAAFDRTQNWRPGAVQSESMAALFARCGVDARSDATYECREAILEVDEAIAAVGAVVREVDPAARPDGMYRDGATSTRFRLVASAAQPLVVSDDPRARR